MGAGGNIQKVESHALSSLPPLNSICTNIIFGFRYFLWPSKDPPGVFGPLPLIDFEIPIQRFLRKSKNA